jgi:hypothetical protein
MRFVLLDHTTEKTPDRLRPGAHFDRLMQALEVWTETFWGEWTGGIVNVAPTSFRVGTSEDRSGREIGVHFRDCLPEAAEALAFHRVTRGVPDIEVGLSQMQSLFEGPQSLSCALAHDVLETLCNPGANGWKERNDGSGILDAEEVCDLVQNTGMALVGPEAFMPNFLLPHFFIPGSEGPWDHLAVLRSQRDTSQGYGIQAVGIHHTPQLLGMNLRLHGEKMVSWAGTLSEEQRQKKAHFTSRTFRRGIRLQWPTPR